MISATSLTEYGINVLFSLVMRLLLTLVISVTLGWLVGRGLGRSQNDPLDSQQPESQKGSATATDPLVSADTLELFTTGTSRLPLDRLAHWLLDAESAEVADLLTQLSSRPERDEIAINLVINALARIDPNSLSLADRDSPHYVEAWKAVTIHHPDLAFRLALEREKNDGDPDALFSVLRALGQFHPEWVQANLDTLPEDWMKQDILEYFQADPENGSPLETIQFLRKNGKDVGIDLIITLGKTDPARALQLAEEFNPEHFSCTNPNIEGLIEALASENPALLDLLLAETKSPVTRQAIEIEKFQQELKADPESAAEAIRDLPKGYLREDKLTALSRHYLESDPDKAVGIFAQLLTGNPHTLKRRTEIIGLNTHHIYYDQVSQPQKLLENLVSTHPESLINATLPRGDDPGGGYRAVGKEWVSQDREAFADWTSGQNDPEVFRESAEILSESFRSEGQYPEAMQWAENTLSQESGNSHLIRSVYQKWYSNNPDEAKSWRAATSLKSEDHAKLDIIEKSTQ